MLTRRSPTNAATLAISGSPVAGKVYFISQGEPVPMWDMVNRLLLAAGAPPVTRSVPVWLALALAVTGMAQIFKRSRQMPA